MVGNKNKSFSSPVELMESGDQRRPQENSKKAHFFWACAATTTQSWTKGRLKQSKTCARARCQAHLSSAGSASLALMSRGLVGGGMALLVIWICRFGWGGGFPFALCTADTSSLPEWGGNQKSPGPGYTTSMVQTQAVQAELNVASPETQGVSLR